jgi:hypothetical protein
MHIRVADEQLCSFFTSTLDERSTLRSAAFILGKESRYLFSRRPGDLQSLYGLVENSKTFRPLQDSNPCSTGTKSTTLLRPPGIIKRSAGGGGGEGHSESRIENDPSKRKFFIFIIIFVIFFKK